MGELLTSQIEFLEKVGAMASADMLRSRILASLTVAQAILESEWGNSSLAVKANALFGIKANTDWSGKVYNSKTQEYIDGIGFVAISTNFRSYDNWMESIADHSAVLTGSPRYAAVVGETNFKKACTYIKAAGYATDPDYAAKLMNIINNYGLTKYDLNGDINLCIDEKVVGVTAENIEGHWYITLPQLGGGKFKIRDILTAAGYNISWEEAYKAIIAVK